MIRFNHPLQSRQASETDVELLPNFPNPFVEMTMLRFNLPNPAQVILRIFNADGQEINQKQASFEEGENHLVLQRNDLREPGVYEYLLETAGTTSGRRKLVMF